MGQHKGSTPWNKGTTGRSQRNRTSFKKGHVPFNKGTIGVMKRNRGSFGGPVNPGGQPIAPTGTLRWDTKGSEWLIKVDQPSPYVGRYPGSSTARAGWWRPRRLVNYEAVHGPAPKGCIVRRLLPDDDDESNLVLITMNINARLNKGDWCQPIRPWRTLPLDQDVRLAAVIAAVATAEARELERTQRVPCACGCGRLRKKFDKYGHRRHYLYRHGRRGRKKAR